MSTSPRTDRNAETDGRFEIDLTQLVRDIRESYDVLPIPFEQYLLLIIIPSFIFPALVIAGFFFIMPMAMMTEVFASLFSLMFPVIPIAYPKILRDRKRKQIRSRFHLFITHLTVLSTTNIERVQVFRKLAKEKEYKAIAEEMGHIVALIDTWNQSLEDACRMRAKKVPSPLMKDFLERLAYTVGAGQKISEFLLNEQDAIIQNFAVRYKSDLDQVSVLNELYMSMIMTITFAMSFGIIMPFLLGINPTLIVGGVLVLYMIVQVLFLFLIHTKSPSDPVWYLNESMALKRNSRIRVSIIIGVSLTILGLGVVYGILSGYLSFVPADKYPIPVYIAAAITPLLIPGLVVRKEEQKVRERDEGFPSFIRALGAVESVKQSSTSTVLEDLRNKDFGSLTSNIQNLYRRLSVRIDSNKAWEWFSGEAGSYLIHKFSDMYVTGRRMGGEPRQLGELISKNMTEVLQLRKRREQDVNTIAGNIYLVVSGSAFGFFVSIQMIGLLQKVVGSMSNVGGASALSGLLNASVYNIPQLKFLLVGAVLANALLSSIMIRLTDRGHMLNTLPHYVIMLWITAVTAYVTEYVTTNFISL